MRLGWALGQALKILIWLSNSFGPVSLGLAPCLKDTVEPTVNVPYGNENKRSLLEATKVLAKTDTLRGERRQSPKVESPLYTARQTLAAAGSIARVFSSTR